MYELPHQPFYWPDLDPAIFVSKLNPALEEEINPWREKIFWENINFGMGSAIVVLENVLIEEIWNIAIN